MKLSLTLNDLDFHQVEAINKVLSKTDFSRILDECAAVMLGASNTTATAHPIGQHVYNPYPSRPTGNGAPHPRETLIGRPHAIEHDTGEIAEEDDATVDNFGVPWHKDFHAETRALNADGSWKRRRGADKKAAGDYEKHYHSLGVKSAAPTNVTPIGLAVMNKAQVQEQQQFAPSPQLAFGAPVQSFAPEPVPSFSDLAAYYETIKHQITLPALLAKFGLTSTDALHTSDDLRVKFMAEMKRVF